MPEWELYPPLTRYWEARGFHVASQVTDPKGSRVELDVVAFTPRVDDVRITEVKLEPSNAFIDQCLDRLEIAPRVYAAVPDAGTERLAELADEPPADAVGILGVGRDGVELHREAQPMPDRRVPSRAHVIERVLRSRLAEGDA